MYMRAKHCLLALFIGCGLLSALWLAMTRPALPATVPASAPMAVRFVNGAGSPIVGQIRVLCFATSAGGSPLADLLVITDSTGHPVPELPSGCDYVAALHLKYEQPSGKPGHGPAYWSYTTSWPPGTATPKPAAGDVAIRDEWPLVLFNVVASLAWEPSPVSTYTAALRQGLRSASGYLYDMTDGRMAFGPATIHSGGRFWNGADLVFLAANDYRPSAYVGGIVSQPLRYAANRQTTFAPGQIFLGRYWDGDDASDPSAGNWTNSDAYRTIVHEFGHYALFLYDEYQRTNGAATFCVCDDLDQGSCSGLPLNLAASTMAYHYVATEMWHPSDHGTPLTCTSTRQWDVYGMSDWETLRAWYGLEPPSTLDPGPPNLGLAEHLFGRQPGHQLFLPAVLHPGAADPPAAELTIDVNLDATPATTETLPSHVYLLKDAVGSPAPGPILVQGSVLADPDPDDPFLEVITLLGVEDQDRARIEVERYTTRDFSGGRFVYPSTIVSDSVLFDGFEALAVQDKWAPSLDFSQALSGSLFTQLTVTLTSLNPPQSFTPTARLCVPDAAIGCDQAWDRGPMLQTGAFTWTAVFTPMAGAAELPLYGVVQVHAPGAGEIIRPVQVLGGVGPAHEWADAPLRDGAATLNFDPKAELPVLGTCNQVLISPAANAASLSAPLPFDPLVIGGLVGPALDIDVVFPTANGCASAGLGDHTLPTATMLTLFYNQDVVNRLLIDPVGLSEPDDLRILRFDRGTNAWTVANTIDSNSNLNWLSTTVREDGIYAIGWVLP